MEDNINSKDFLIGTLIGGIVGASIALVFAPKSGKELRENLNQSTNSVKYRANNMKEVAQEKGNDFKGIALEKGSELKRKAVDQTAQLTKTVTDKTKDLTKTAQNKINEKKSKTDDSLKAVEEVSNAIENATKNVK